MSADEIHEGYYATNLDRERLRAAGIALAPPPSHTASAAAHPAPPPPASTHVHAHAPQDPEELREDAQALKEEEEEEEREREREGRPPKSHVYTRTGDKGTTSLYTGERRSKADPIFDALGTIDELNAHVAVAREHALLCPALTPSPTSTSSTTTASAPAPTTPTTPEPPARSLPALLEEIQSRLFDIGTHVATPLTAASPHHAARAYFDPANLHELEAVIDELDAELAPLKNFILPGGSVLAAELHVCRTVCRRAERLLTPLYLTGALDETVLKFVNRLSDLFFVAARWVCRKEGKRELTYKKGVGLSPHH